MAGNLLKKELPDQFAVPFFVIRVAKVNPTIYSDAAVLPSEMP